MLRKIVNIFIPVSIGVKEIGKQMIEKPLEWEQRHYEFINIKSKDIRIWTCNGWSFIKINGFNGLSYTDKIYLNNCIKTSIANRLWQTL